MLTCRACERLGIRTVVLVAETNAGLTDHVPEADAMVSVGNEEELVAEWRARRVVGGDVMLDGQPAREPPTAAGGELSGCTVSDGRHARARGAGVRVAA